MTIRIILSLSLQLFAALHHNEGHPEHKFELHARKQGAAVMGPATV